MSNLIEVLLPNALNHGFDYAVPEGMRAPRGSIVTVPISSKETLGIVWGEGTSKLDAAKIKSIIAVHDFPPHAPKFLEFLKWSAWYNGAAIGAFAKMVLPIADIAKEGRTKAAIAEVNPNTITTAALSKEQQAAAHILGQKMVEGFSVSLLDGVTGSGKTEVYFDVIARLLRYQVTGVRCQKDDSSDTRHLTPDTQILVLLPEIALSVQWLKRFQERFGFAPVLWHSNVTPAKRREAWKAIARGQARVVVGARSALFLPYPNLSLIVVDEEHDGSYKQEEGVIYHARDMAIARGRHENFPVILVSATPSLETVYNVRQGKFSEVTLPLRHAAAQMPDIHLIDMRGEKLERDAFISTPLREAITHAIASGHQAMLFLNRRGYAPLVLCRKCGHRFQCPDCSAWLVLHQKGKRLQCHHCNYHIPMPKQCPECEAEDSLHPCGPGVERVHEEVTQFLPQARVATLTSDSTANHKELSAIIEAMEAHEIDILIGTQMIAKGHHFGGLSVVGVVDADLGLAGGDLRAAEKTYQLLHQISGRAGREQTHGHVYLQSYIPTHPVMEALGSGARDAFFAAELQSRETAHMPPFSRLAALIIEGHEEAEVIAATKQLSSLIPRPSSLHIYGPAPAPLAMLRGKFRYRFLVNAPRAINLPDFIRSWVDAAKIPRSVRVKIDIDPMSFM